MSDRIPTGGVRKPLTDEQLDLFRKLLSVIDIKDLSLRGASYNRLVENIETKENNLLNFETTNLINTEDPSWVNNSFVVVRPIYKIDVVMNDKRIMETQYKYNIVFSVMDKPQFTACMSDEGVKHFFLENQIMRILWGYIREEIATAMLKCGLQAAQLPLLK